MLAFGSIKLLGFGLDEVPGLAELGQEVASGVSPRARALPDWRQGGADVGLRRRELELRRVKRGGHGVQRVGDHV